MKRFQTITPQNSTPFPQRALLSNSHQLPYRPQLEGHRPLPECILRALLAELKG
jgi:hypothetical protein